MESVVDQTRLRLHRERTERKNFINLYYFIKYLILIIVVFFKINCKRFCKFNTNFVIYDF
jgi:hypothetical protein